LSDAFLIQNSLKQEDSILFQNIPLGKFKETGKAGTEWGTSVFRQLPAGQIYKYYKEMHSCIGASKADGLEINTHN
jgi:hypothetical protein